MRRFNLQKVSQSSRRRSGANKFQSVFCGGVYVAKNTLHGVGVSQTRRERRVKARSEVNPFIAKSMTFAVKLNA